VYGLLTTAAVLLSAHPGPESALRARVLLAPKDVAAFVERRADCNHWLGEVPYDRARAAEIDRAVRELRCGDLENEEAELRRRYCQHPAVLMLLDETADLLSW
jgi:hypothetical protein